VNEKPESVNIIYDGECPICSGLKSFAETRSEHRQLNFISYHSDTLSELSPNLTQEEASQSLYLITEDGKQHKGARAVFEIMSQLQGLMGIIGNILKLPPFYWIAEPFYRVVAKHRHKISTSTETNHS
jgi:predicted DCC family thiol-disulfide oxidoreductase YuxK